MARKKKNDEEPIENQDNPNNDSDDTFGLPEVAYEPIKRDQNEPPAEVPPAPVEEPVADTVDEPVYEKPYENVEEPIENTYQPPQHQEEEQNEYSQTYAYMEREQPSLWPKILIIGLLLLALGGIYYFAVIRPDQKEARAIEIREAAAKEADRKKKALAAAAIAKQRADDEQRKADSIAAIPKVGTLEMLSARTGQYYIVVASALDDDLLTDYGNKLIQTGKNVKIIPPFGKTGKFYRLAVEAKDNYSDAQAAADGMKGGDFGDQLWVVRY